MLALSNRGDLTLALGCLGVGRLEWQRQVMKWPSTYHLGEEAVTARAAGMKGRGATRTWRYK
jgi:hypothetical protein